MHRCLVPGVQLPKIRRILSALDAATEPDDMDFPGFRLHPLKGELAGFFAVSVNGNWRVTFQFVNETPKEVDLVDYH